MRGKLEGNWQNCTEFFTATVAKDAKVRSRSSGIRKTYFLDSDFDWFILQNGLCHLRLRSASNVGAAIAMITVGQG
jgi:hypothetical protein